MKRLLFLAAFLLWGALSLAADEMGVRAALEASVARGDVAGVVSIIARADYSEQIDCVGYADLSTKRPMTPDTLFALFSSSKSVCGTAVMILVGEGKLALEDPVSKYLPEFANIQVEEKDPNGKVHLVPPKRPVTIRDLMAHTTGTRFRPPIIHRDYPLRVGAWWLAQTPFKFHPGETFSYNNAGIDAGGAVVEIIAGMPFEQFCEERIFKPLGMKDTTFRPNAEQISRLAKCYNSDGKPLVEQHEGYARQTVLPAANPVIYPAPSAGLYSTPRDFIRYSEMLAHHGTYKSVCLIPRALFDSVFCVKQTAPNIDQPYTVGNWIRGDWFGHSGALKTDQRANIKTGHCRLFFVQIQVPAGDGFERCKDAWNIAVDAIQGSEGATPCWDHSTKRTSENGKVLRGR